MITRRKFFSFFGAGVVMAAAPDLLSSRRPTSIQVNFSKNVPIRFDPLPNEGSDLYFDVKNNIFYVWRNFKDKEGIPYWEPLVGVQ